MSVFLSFTRKTFNSNDEKNVQNISSKNVYWILSNENLTNTRTRSILHIRFLISKSIMQCGKFVCYMLQIHTTANWIEWIIQSCGNVLNPAHFNGFNFNLLLAIKTILIAFYFVSIVIIGLLLCPFRLKEKS